LGAKRLILAGWATNLCVLFTASEGYVREYELFIPSDCVAAKNKPENRYALEFCQKAMKANISPSGTLIRHLKRRREK
jgi:nicotinamidase-related amidase